MTHLEHKKCSSLILPGGPPQNEPNHYKTMGETAQWKADHLAKQLSRGQQVTQLLDQYTAQYWKAVDLRKGL